MCTAQGVVSGLFPKDVEAGTMDVDVSLNGSNEYMVLNGRHVPYVHLCTHPLYMYIPPIYTTYTPNTPLNTLNTPYIRLTTTYVLNGRHCARLAELFRKGCDLSSTYLPDSARAVAKAVESGAESWMRDGPWKVRATLYCKATYSSRILRMIFSVLIAKYEH